MKISLCVITKNEENNIKKCLESAGDVLFEKIVVDTGSTDKTTEIAKKMGAKVYNFKWIDDFSAARNFAISKAKGDWILFLDADEHIELTQMNLLEKIVIQANKENKDCVNSRLINYTIASSDKKNMQSITTNIRIFKNSKELRYFGAIHEMLLPINNRQLRIFDSSNSLIVYHSGYSSEEVKRKDKSNRNLTLLFKDLEKKPDSILTLFYIGESLMIAQKYEEAVTYLTRAKELLLKHNNKHPLLYKIYCNLLICLIRPSFEFNQFDEMYKDANQFDKNCPDFDFYMGKKLYMLGNYENAIEYYELCIRKISNFSYNFESKVLSQLNNIYEELLNLYILTENRHKIVEVCVALLKADKYNYKSLLILVKTLKDFEKSADIYNFLFKIYSEDNIKDKLYILRVTESLEFNELYEQVMTLLSEQEKTEYLLFKEQDEESQEEYQLEVQDLSAIECLHRAKFYKKKNKLNKSLFFKEKAFEKNPQLALDIFPENQSNQIDNHYVEEETEKVKEKVIDLFSQGLYDEALEVIDQSLQMITDDADLYSIKAVVLIKQDKYVEAEEALNKGLTIDSEHVDCLYNLAFIYEQENNLTKAIGLYKEVLHQSNEDGVLEEVKSKLNHIDPDFRAIPISNKDSLEENYHKKTSPIFIGGAGRSGTTLLRVMLNAHPNLCSGPEFKMLQPIANLYNQMISIEDIRNAYNINKDDVNRSFSSFISSFFGKFKLENTANRIVEKTPHNILIMKELINIFPDAKFIHVFRDGRDVASSLVTMNWHDFQGKPLPYVQNIQNATDYWKQVITKSFTDSNDPILKGKVKFIKYEDLIAEPKKLMKDILTFIEEPWSEQVLDYSNVDRGYEPNESSTSQVSKQIYTNSKKRWQRDFTEKDKQVFKEIAGSLLIDLGYENNFNW
ncbi:sulfotransferase [Virgibacillus necropolis]|uniref:sulfotransferase n=1 Tax=Virgibacillus necropolis TaxID=163877 RepID=UPI00384CE392